MLRLQRVHAVSSSATLVPLTRIGCNEVDEQLNALFLMRTFAHACTLFRDFSDRCEGITLIEGQFFFSSARIFVTRFAVT